VEGKKNKKRRTCEKGETPPYSKSKPDRGERLRRQGDPSKRRGGRSVGDLQGANTSLTFRSEGWVRKDSSWASEQLPGISGRGTQKKEGTWAKWSLQTDASGREGKKGVRNTSDFTKTEPGQKALLKESQLL